MDKRTKVITICGSLKFKEEMMKAAVRMELAGNVVLTPIFPVNDDKNAYTEEEIAMLGKMHKEKIRLSDAIFVVNVGGYIGESARSEIKFAKELGVEILYLEA